MSEALTSQDFESLDSIFDEIFRSIIAVDRPYPDKLYHYTSADGLFGILRDRVLWATDSKFLNDLSEGAHGVTLIQAIADARSDLPDVMLAFLEASTLEVAGTPAWIVSFTEDRDSLQHWRGYSGRGYALGAAPSWIKRAGLPGAPATLSRVIYSESEQSSMVGGVFDALVQWYSAETHPKRDSMVPWLMRAAFAVLIPLLKDEGFASEHEWRLVVSSVLSSVTPKVRPDRGYLVPYIELKLPISPGVGFAETLVGPGPHQEAAKLGVKTAERRFEWPPSDVSISRLPFRDYW